MRFSIIPILCGLLIATACTRTVNDNEHAIKPPAPQQLAQTKPQTATSPPKTESENSKKEEAKQETDQPKTNTSAKRDQDSRKKETSIKPKNENSAKTAKPATPQSKTTTKNQPQTDSQYTILEIEKEVVRLVNEERAKQGLSPLTMTTTLSKIARTKCEDMRDRQYFSHQSPTYGSPFDMLRRFGVNYRTAGENIAAGQRTAEEVVKSWMQSEGHRTNILNPSYTQIGVGFVKGGNYGTLWTQIFIGK